MKQIERQWPRKSSLTALAEQWCLWEDAGVLPVLGGEGFEEKWPIVLLILLGSLSSETMPLDKCPTQPSKHSLHPHVQVDTPYCGRNRCGLEWPPVLLTNLFMTCWMRCGHGDFSRYLTSVGSEVSFFDFLEGETVWKMGHGKGGCLISRAAEK